MFRDIGKYAWSLRSLDKRLSYFNIHRNDKDVLVVNLKSALNKEPMGRGRLLGYRTMHLKIKNIHRLDLPADLVYPAMWILI